MSVNHTAKYLHTALGIDDARMHHLIDRYIDPACLASAKMSEVIQSFIYAEADGDITKYELAFMVFIYANRLRDAMGTKMIERRTS